MYVLVKSYVSIDKLVYVLVKSSMLNDKWLVKFVSFWIVICCCRLLQTSFVMYVRYSNISSSKDSGF